MNKKNEDLKDNVKAQAPNLMTSFVDGAKKGMDISMNSLIPNVAFAFTITRVLQLLGVIDFIGKLLGPVMAIFGLPGIAAVPLVLNISAIAAGFGSAVSLASTGALTSDHLFMMIPTMMLTGAFFIFTSRILLITKIKSKDFKVVYVITLLNGIIALFIMKIIMQFV